MVNPGKISWQNDYKWILIGEDDMDDKEIIEEAFAEIDPSVKIQFVCNGEILLSYFDGKSNKIIPSLIVLDYNMPGLNGAEILKCLNSNLRVKNVPKIIWSTSGATRYKSICLQLGAEDYLVKPATIAELENTVKYMLSFCNSTSAI